MMISHILKVLLIYGFPTWIGFVILNLIKGEEKHFGALEKYALSLGIGTGFVALFILIIGIINIPITMWSISILFFISVPVCLISYKKRRIKILHFRKSLRKKGFKYHPLWQKILFILVVTLLVGKIIYICFFSWTVPPFFDDSVSRWNFKAKVFYLNNSLILDPLHPDFLGGTALRYPLGNSLFKSWTAFASGGWIEQYINLYGAAIYLVMLIISYYRFRSFLDNFYSIIFSYLLVSIPLLVFHAGTGYTDGILGLYFSFSLIYLYNGLKENYPGYIIIASILTVIALFTKAEALSYFISGTIPMIGCYLVINKKVSLRKKINNISLYLIPLIILIFPWFWLKTVYHIVQTLPASRYALEFHPEGFSIIISNLFNSGNFNIVWVIIFLVIFCGLKKIFKTDMLWLFVACLGLMFNLIFFHIFTSLFEFLNIGTQFNRLLLHILPLYIFLVAQLVGYWVPQGVEA